MIERKKLLIVLAGITAIVAFGTIVVWMFFDKNQLRQSDAFIPDEKVFTPTDIKEEYRQIKTADMEDFLKSDDPVARILRTAPDPQSLKK